MDFRGPLKRAGAAESLNGYRYTARKLRGAGHGMRGFHHTWQGSFKALALRSAPRRNFTTPYFIHGPFGPAH